ncbi:MAG TPA: methyltransferase domain-containing protein [Thermoleophilaceae bacterium]
MALHPLATRFADAADVYERGRPAYAPAVVGALCAELGLTAGAPVLDLGAGTGKLTCALLDFGLDVVAVEPQAELRELLAAVVGADRAREGLAEAIPLPDGSVDAVTVADAFHWFDRAAALAEIARVLCPGGGLALLSTGPDWRGASWGDEVGKLMEGLRPEHPGIGGQAWQDVVREAGGFAAPREVHVKVWQPASPERFLDYIASVSWVAAMPEDERAATIGRIEALIRAGETPAEIPVRTVIGLTTLLP